MKSPVRAGDRASSMATDARQPGLASTMSSDSPGRGEEDTGYYSTIVPVWISQSEEPENKVLTYALLDSQSSTSFMSEDMARRLQVREAPRVDLELTTLGNTRVISSHRVERLQIQEFQRHQEPLELRKCFTRLQIPGDRGCIADPEVVRKKHHLLEAAEGIPRIMPEVEIGLLVGNDCHGCLKPQRVLQTEEDPMYAMYTPLGWTVVGPTFPGAPVRVLCHRVECREITDTLLKEAFDLGFEEPDRPENMMSADDLKFMKIMKDEMEIVDGHIQLPFPLRREAENLPDSRPDAIRCLFANKKRMDRDPEWGKKYVEAVNNMIFRDNQAEPVPQPDNVPRDKTWYWLMHGVTNPKKPDKVRNVFNGSHEVEDFCINDLLLQGPDLTNNLVGVLCRYRIYVVPVKCDVEGMFLQVWLAPKHRDLTRFVWFQDGDPSKKVIDYRMKVHLFGAKSSPSCANYAFKATAEMYEAKYGTEAANFVRKNFYVDDGLGGSEDSSGAIRLAENTRAMCSETGFNLHKFCSSQKEVIAALPQEIVDKGLQSLELTTDTLPDDKALGIDVSLEKDALEYKVRLQNKPATRRGCLSGLSSVYDPLGLVGPAILPGRRLLQKMCLEKLEWDKALSEEQTAEWERWYQGLSELHELSIPRCVLKNITEGIVLRELHMCCDASLSGLGAACYLYLKDSAGNEDVTLMYAKSKVPPSKVTTVPRLELQAAVLGTKMANFIKEELGFGDLVLVFWCDSMVVLVYIHNEDKRFYMYVTNRADYIRKNTIKGNWRHIATELNPADLASRGCTARELIESKLWWNGHPGICQANREPQEIPEVDPNDPELRKSVTALFVEVSRNAIGKVASRVSKWETALGVVANVLRYWHLRTRQTDCAVHNRRRAMVLLIKAHQEAEYPDYFRGVMRSDGALKDLSPYLDQDGLLRVGGRIERCPNVESKDKHPMIIPKKGDLTRLLVRYYHGRTQHMGVDGTLNALRHDGLWLVNGRSTTRYSIMSCVTCKRRRGRPMSQQMAELPADRLTVAPPFTHSAVDLFGPYRVMCGRTSRKRWGCLFVCLVSRGVHVEIVHTLGTSSYLNAYRRFTSRRGPVKSLRCDRGTNFAGADGDVERAHAEMDHDQITCTLAMDGCDYLRHKFNSPKSSHMGGSWERLIRTVRNAMDYVLARPPAALDDEMLVTVAAEAEAIVNQRPLTYVSGSDPEAPLPLTPALLLTGKRENVGSLPGKRSSAEVYMRQRWRYVEYLVSLFWERWRREILPLLNLRSKWQQEKPGCVKGTVVLMVEDSLPRSDWPLAIVEELIPGGDGKSRRVKLRVRGTLMERPIHRLIELLPADGEPGNSPIEEP